MKDLDKPEEKAENKDGGTGDAVDASAGTGNVIDGDMVVDEGSAVVDTGGANYEFNSSDKDD